MRKILHILSGITLLVGLTACGGGGGGTGPVEPNPNPIPNNGQGKAERLELDDGSAHAPEIAMAADGRAIAVWQQFDGTHNRVWVRSYDPMTGWGNAETIDDPVQEDDILFPKVAMNDSGQAVVVWSQTINNDFLPSIWASTYDNNSGWSSPVVIETETGWAVSPEVTIDNQGNAIALWWQVEVIGVGNSRERIYSNYMSGGNWQDAIPVDDGMSELFWFPSIQMSPAGNAIAVWQNRIDADSYGINAARFSVNDGWSAQEQVATTTDALLSTSISVTQLTENQRIVIWSVLDQNVNSILRARHFDGSQWQATQQLGEGGVPDIASDNNGQAIAVYTLYSLNTEDGVYANRFVNGSWQTRQRIDNLDQFTIENHITMNSNGEAIAIWEQFVPQSTHNVLHANYFDGTNWQTALALDDRDTGDMERANLDMDDSGNAIVVWEQDNLANDIWVNRINLQ